MDSYYYLMSSLPDLTADGDMPITYSEFLTCCESNVSEEKLKLLKDLTLSSTEGPLVSEWAAFYHALRGELNTQRCQKLGKTYTSAFDKDVYTAQVVDFALAAANPLEAERILLGYEFRYLDMLVGPHTFDDYGLFGYAIKLKLLERLTSFSHEKGKAEFQTLFDGIQQQVYSL